MSALRARLRERIAQPEILVAPGAYDALTARLVESAGFEAVYLTGSGVSYTSLACPDLSLTTETEMVRKVWDLAGTVDIPIIADADTGYGGVLNVARTVRDYERAGAAAIQLEDQVFPKRCGHYEGKEVVPVDEMVARLSAALDARTDPDLLIIARTDARATHGIDEALRRASAYAEAGADLLFVEAPRTREELQAVTTSLDKPCMANMVEGGKTPLLDAGELQQIGFRLVIFPNSITRTLVHAVRGLLAELLTTGTTAGRRLEMVDFDELSRVVGLPAALEHEARFARGADSRSRISA